jgi:hypothetical protein
MCDEDEAARFLEASSQPQLSLSVEVRINTKMKKV